MDTGTDTTVLEFFRRNNTYTGVTGQPIDIRAVLWLNDAGVGGTPRMMAYEKNSDNLTMRMPIPWRSLPPQATALRLEIPNEYKISGTEFRYPLSAAYRDVVNNGTGPRTARAITINEGDKTYNIVPGGDASEFVDVPDSVVRGKFVQNLINSGDLIVKGYKEPVKGEDDEEDEKLATLRQEAQSLGLKVDARWKAERLQKEIDEAKAPE
ncbi:unnamed protein product [Nesidiocoris tenuis]|uniref:Uncharacterized protein n=1 Tax=Nesidiocoris tenuis TaxID=355587 RepID=A0A6H5FUZ9_9HEMI|nr:unnamed protein product [Nesidiocoris tenuis]